MRESFEEKIKDINKTCDRILESMPTQMKWEMIDYAYGRGIHRGFWIGSLLTTVGIVAVAYLVERFLR